MPFFETPHARIAYDVHVPSAGASKLLVMLNGFRRPRQDFRALRRRLHTLDNTLATLAIDHLGSGETESQSMSNLSPQLELLAHDVCTVASHVATDLGFSHYSLLGISMGGMIAQLAARENNSLSKLVLISTSPRAIERLSHEIPLRDYFGNTFSASHIAMVEAFVKSVESESAKQANTEKARWQRSEIEKFDISDTLHNVICPTLIISGDDDVVIPHSNSVELSRNIPHSLLVLYPGVGHILLVESPDRLALDVSSFLNS